MTSEEVLCNDVILAELGSILFSYFDNSRGTEIAYLLVGF